MTTDAPPLQANATRDLAEFAAGPTFEQIPAEVVRHAKLCLLDGLGVCLHGATLPWTRIVQDMVIAEGGNGRVSIWGRGNAPPGRRRCWPTARPGMRSRWTISTRSR